MYLTRTWYVKNIDIFNRVTLERLKRAVSFTSMRRVGRHQNIFFPEEAAGHVLLIQNGSIKLSRLLENGRSQTLDVLYTGDVCGEHSGLKDVERNEYAEAVEDVLICAITKQSFHELLKESPELHFSLPPRAGVRPCEFSVGISELAFKAPMERIIRVLDLCCESFGKSIRGSCTIELPLSQHETAHLAGVSPEAAMMVLEELKGRRLIESAPDFFAIPDLARLRNYKGSVQNYKG